jgi:hypothetical protein
MGVGLGSGHDQQQDSVERMENSCHNNNNSSIDSCHNSSINSNNSMDSAHASAMMHVNVKEEAETSADSLTIDVEGHDDNIIQADQLNLKTEVDPVESKAWITALRTHVVVPLIRIG